MTNELRPIEEYHEDMGAVLWWKFPIDEPPYVGGPFDCGHTVYVSMESAYGEGVSNCMQVGAWPGYHTHFQEIDIPDPPERVRESHGAPQTGFPGPQRPFRGMDK